MTAIETLISVLCDPEGKCCISGSDDDRRLIDSALAELAQAAQPAPATQQAQAHAQAGAVPLDEARRLFYAGWKAAALLCDREDVLADGIIGFGACPQFEAAFSAANGSKGG